MIRKVFLSASIPVVGRGNFHETADPFLIQFAIRELLTVCLGRRMLVWGGHPAITPMVWAVCEDLDVSYAKAVTLYQSMLFKDLFPRENQHFANCVFVKAVEKDRERSLERMRREMLSPPFEAGIFIGGMEGLIDEYKIFVELNPTATILAVPSPGGAAQVLSRGLGQLNDRIDFARLFYEKLGIAVTEARDLIG